MRFFFCFFCPSPFSVDLEVGCTFMNINYVKDVGVCVIKRGCICIQKGIDE